MCVCVCVCVQLLSLFDYSMNKKYKGHKEPYWDEYKDTDEIKAQMSSSLVKKEQETCNFIKMISSTDISQNFCLGFHQIFLTFYNSKKTYFPEHLQGST